MIESEDPTGIPSQVRVEAGNQVSLIEMNARHSMYPRCTPVGTWCCVCNVGTRYVSSHDYKGCYVGTFIAVVKVLHECGMVYELAGIFTIHGAPLWWKLAINIRVHYLSND